MEESLNVKRVHVVLKATNKSDIKVEGGEEEGSVSRPVCTGKTSGVPPGPYGVQHK